MSERIVSTPQLTAPRSKVRRRSCVCDSVNLACVCKVMWLCKCKCWMSLREGDWEDSRALSLAKETASPTGPLDSIAPALSHFVKLTPSISNIGVARINGAQVRRNEKLCVARYPASLGPGAERNTGSHREGAPSIPSSTFRPHHHDDI